MKLDLASSQLRCKLEKGQTCTTISFHRGLHNTEPKKLAVILHLTKNGTDFNFCNLTRRPRQILKLLLQCLHSGVQIFTVGLDRSHVFAECLLHLQQSSSAAEELALHLTTGEWQLFTQDSTMSSQFLSPLKAWFRVSSRDLGFAVGLCRGESMPG